MKYSYSPLLSVLLWLGLSTITRAQVTQDGFLSTTVDSTDNLNFTIENGDRAGTNLFHSFDEFSIPTNGSAHFDNAADIANIFGRVTGSSVSDIDGLIQANDSANLFLINPNGIVFGPNASLDIGGSFLGTTADRVLFDNNQFFSATTDVATPPLLQISTPIGLQWGATPAPITVQGPGHSLSLTAFFTPDRTNRPVGLEVNTGQTLGLMGGDILFEGGNLTANQGRIELGSVAQAGVVDLEFISTETAPASQERVIEGFTADYSNIQAFGALQFTQESSVDVSGEGSGDLHFQSGQMAVIDSSVIISNILGSDNGGEVVMRAAESIDIAAPNTTFFPSAVFNQAELNSTGNAGNVLIETDALSVGNNAFISNSIVGNGRGGDLTITAGDVDIKGSTVPGYSSGLFTQILGGGVTTQGGTIMLTADTLQMTYGGAISSSLALGTSGPGEGNGGDIHIKAQHVELLDGSSISSTTTGNGDAGDITLSLSGTLFMSGSGNFGPSNINTLAIGLNSEEGNGGNINITAQRLEVVDGALISGSTSANGDGGDITLTISDTLLIGGSGIFGPSAIVSQSGGRTLDGSILSGDGKPGEINITARRLEVIDGSSLSTTTVGNGDAGDITLTVSDTILIQGENAFGPSNIASESDNVSPNGTPVVVEGNSGNITISAQDLEIVDGGIISNSTDTNGDAGDITLTISDTLLVSGSNSLNPSSITSLAGTTSSRDIVGTTNLDGSRFGGEGNGGEINISARTLQITDGGKISGQAFSEGDAGTIRVQAQAIEIRGVGSTDAADNVVSAIETSAVSTSTGNAGLIQVESDTVGLFEGGRISTQTDSDGNGGQITVAARTLELNGLNAPTLHPTQITAAVGESARGNGGTIALDISETVHVVEGAQIANSTAGAGTAGDITINAAQLDLVGAANAGDGENTTVTAGVRGNVSGNGGNLTVDVGGLNLSAGATLSTATQGSGAGGNIAVTADRVVIDGQSTSGTASGLSAAVESGASGQGGQVSLTAENVALTNGGTITTSTAGPSNAGAITINSTGAFTLDNSRIESAASSESTGDGGSVSLTSQRVALSNQSEITTANQGSGNAGQVSITTTDDVALSGQSTMSSSVAVNGNGNAGSVIVNAGGAIALDNSTVSSAIGQNTTGNSGSLRLTGSALALTNGAQLTTTTDGMGNAGSIEVATTGAIELAQGTIASEIGTAAVGDGGHVALNGDSLTLRQGSQLTTASKGQGNAGEIDVQVNDSILLTGNSTLSSAVADNAQGNAGQVTVAAGGEIVLRNSDISGEIGTGATGDGGSVTLTGDSLRLSNGATLTTATRGNGNAGDVALTVTNGITIEAQSSVSSSVADNAQGNAGNVTVDAGGAIALDNSTFSSAIGTNATGNSGSLRLAGDSLSLTNGAQLSTTTEGTGNAGSIEIGVAGAIELAQGTIASEIGADAVGDGGSISVRSDSLTLRQVSQFTTASKGEGSAGEIEVQVVNAMSLSDGSVLSSSVGDGAQGDAGQVTVTAGGDIALDNSEISGEIGSGATGDGGSIVLNGNALQLSNGSTVTTATQGQGNAGDVTLTMVDSVTLEGQSSVSSSVGANAQGNAGNIAVDTGGAITLDNSSITGDIGAGAAGSGGTVQLTGSSLALSNGSILSTTTSGSGDAGDIQIEIDGVTRLSGGSQISSSALAESNVVSQNAVNTRRRISRNSTPSRNTGATIGNAGDISLTTAELQLENSLIVANNESSGQGGNITIVAADETVLSGSEIAANTASGDGGNLTLNLGNLFLFRDGSSISTTAGASGAGGDGGNMYIAAQYIIGQGNSDITANAFEGQGGQIIITTQGLLGLAFSPVLTDDNDITATSEFGVNGTVDINTPNTTPDGNVIELPNALVDGSQLVRPGCSLEQDRFVIAGRGGLTSSPFDLIESDVVWVDLRDLSAFLNNPSDNLASESAEAPTTNELLQEATRMVLAPNGTLQLVTVNPQNITMPHASCTSPSNVALLSRVTLPGRARRSL